jgi:hypothetical protein
MKGLNHEKLWGFLFAACIVLSFLAYHRWQNFHYRDPMIAFKALSLAMEQDDKAALAEVAPGIPRQRLEELAKPYGGLRPLGKLLRESKEVAPYIHVPLGSVDVVAKVKGRLCLVQFVKKQGQHRAVVIFFAEETRPG